ncbi:hypothetical protein EUTSA_v10022230mg [Eutrema salsugineum]|uniref:F-box domain-containing protein n=1 Tax=Eutrema salsugineum TaxID=72664 RepID=V4LGI4_EUTSA|nr:F-box/kelch-repeat protein At3g04660 [Eutrema salsugineum]ESQ49620.1 hypothetical protein EUTSA_v10022230mg [Eutrema salsugineum]
MKKRVTRSQKRDESDENDPFSTIPLELKVEILMKLPPKSIAMLSFVSKNWSSIIRSKDFTNLYLTRSSTRPRLLFSVYLPGDVQTRFFQSCSQEDPSSSDHHRVSYTLTSDPRYSFSTPIRGLICGRNGTKMIIGNPSTGQFVTLPRVKTCRQDILSAFGYDPVNDVFKVLCMTVTSRRRRTRHALSKEHQVFTLGPRQKWRMMECKYPHRHYSNSKVICRDGVLYYLASFKDKRSLISFDLRSEEFDVTKLPEDYTLQEFGNLVNHTGKITIASQAYNGTIDLWVLENTNKEEWSKAASVAPSWTDIAGNEHLFTFRGILGTGEIILAMLACPNPYFFICYDPKEKIVRKVFVEGIGDDSAAIQVFFDHVESPMFL